MRMVAEYREHAEECRELARRLTSPRDKTTLEKMARSWEMLAQLRKQDVEPEQDAA